jgi:hypothetical protein
MPIFGQIVAGSSMNEAFPAFGGFAKYASNIVLGLLRRACWLFNLAVAEWIIRRPARGCQMPDTGQPSSRAWAAA